jgi:uncharacterized protein YdbL (DUF1318 family)
VLAAVLILSLVGAFSWPRWREGRVERAGIACAEMTDALEREDWDGARRRLQEDRSPLGDCLPADEFESLDRCFRELEAAEARRRTRPETVETLAAAVAHYETARETARRLEIAPNLEAHLAGLLAAAETRRNELAERRARETEVESARAAWREIEGLLDAGEWEPAQRRFAEQRELLARHFADESQRLDRFFQEMDAAQEQRQARPETAETLAAAVAGYEKAKEAAGRLEVAPKLETHIAGLLAAAETRRKELAERRARETEAESARAAWREIEGFLDVGEWKRAQRLFRERREVLARHFAEPSDRLVEFFETLSGTLETLSRSRASDAEIAAAVAELNAAKETEFGRRMAEFIDAETRRAANLRAERERVRAAEARYDEIVRLTNDEKWTEARAALDRDRDSIRADLDSDRSGNLDGLARFFRLVEEAETARARRPETIGAMETAIARYREALPVARALPTDIRLLRPAQARLRRVENRRDQLAEAGKRQTNGTTKPGRTEKERDGRFVLYEDGTVLDTQTNLLWAAADNGKNVDWKEAKAYCENYRGGGWRMPTQDELWTLVGSENGATKGFDCCRGCDNHIATRLIRLSCTWVWASETKDNGSAAAFVLFSYGARYWYLPSVSPNRRALPVRSGN